MDASFVSMTGNSMRLNCSQKQNYIQQSVMPSLPAAAGNEASV